MKNAAVKGSRVHRQRRCLANDAGKISTIDSQRDSAFVHANRVQWVGGCIKKKVQKEKKIKQKGIRENRGEVFLHSSRPSDTTKILNNIRTNCFSVEN